jgi:ornithine decarboxylase
MKYYADIIEEYKEFFEKELGCEFIEQTLCHKDSLRQYISDKINTNSSDDDDGEESDAFYVVDLSHVVRQVLWWKQNLPQVQIRYAVKCNPNPLILRVLEHMNVGFDCASREEIKAVLELKHSHVDCDTGKFDMKRIIFANPCKQISHIRYAREQGIQYTTLDNEEEIYKLAKYWPEAKCVIRISTDDSNSLCQFSSKFGANLERAQKIIKAAQQCNMELIGVSFHVGSGCQDTDSFEKAISSARKVFDMAKQNGFQMKLLDIGGGFPGFSQGSNSSKLKKAASFDQICEKVRYSLDKYFSDVEGVEFIGEPGRFIARGTHTLAINVFAKRDCRAGIEPVPDVPVHSIMNESTENATGDSFLYYVNDGIYQSFNNIYFDHYVPKINLVEEKHGEEEMINKYPSTLFGPTCDSIDVICKHEMLPELQIGDWLFFTNHGSYTTCCATIGFNGFSTDKKYYVWRN